MAEKPPHRCLVCEPGHHAHLWTLWPEATAADVERASRVSLDLVPALARRATEAEAHRLVGNLEEHKALWISQHPIQPA